MSVLEQIRLEKKWIIHKWHEYGDGRDAELYCLLRSGLSIESCLQKGFLLDGVEEFEGNCLLNEGIQLLEELITGIDVSSYKWDNSHAYLGVGDSSASEDPTQTGLQAATNKTWKGMDTGYPLRSGQTLSWRATFGDAEGNHGWKEFTVVNASTDAGKNLNRKVNDKGTKTSGTWTLTLQTTFS